MINWNEVTVGETEIVNAKGRKFLVVCIHDGDAWLYDTQVKYHFDRTIESLKDWTIYDPWEDVSDACRWVKSPGSNYEWIIYHNGKAVEFDNPNFKSDGRRVWTHKEG